jgi:hypothetical protein
MALYGFGEKEVKAIKFEHGGVSAEEMIVPVVLLKKRQALPVHSKPSVSVRVVSAETKDLELEIVLENPNDVELEALECTLYFSGYDYQTAFPVIKGNGKVIFNWKPRRIKVKTTSIIVELTYRMMDQQITKQVQKVEVENVTVKGDSLIPEFFD